MFSEQPRSFYRRAQLLEVICQLRFPTVLSIGTSDPVEFQEKIRASYPNYQSLAPKDGEQSGRSHQFVSADGCWKVSLTNSFLALSTLRYPGWENFAARLDELLAKFIEVYRPERFQRIGLRYVNAFSRKALGLQGVPFRELIQPAYLGLLAEEDAEEHRFARVSQEVDVAVSAGGRMKLRCGPGQINRGGKPDDEVRYFLDLDSYLVGNTELRLCVAALNTLHDGAWRVFRNALTDRLHEALEPLQAQ